MHGPGGNTEENKAVAKELADTCSKIVVQIDRILEKAEGV